MPTWVDDISTALENLGGVAPLASIYAEVKKLRPKPHPKAIEATIRGAIERSSSSSKAHTGGKDRFFSVHGLGAGVWGLRSYIPPTPTANDIGTLPIGTSEPTRTEQTIYRILRETELARKIKLLHKNKCQLCSTVVDLAGKSYSEAHHIKPLGHPHFGPDTPENIVVVCPNCHVQLDYFAIQIDPQNLSVQNGHQISSAFIEYHNSHVKSL